MKKGTLIKLIILAAVFLFAGAVLLFMFVSDNDSESGKPASVPDSSSSQAQVSSAQKSEAVAGPESTAQSEADSTDERDISQKAEEAVQSAGEALSQTGLESSDALDSAAMLSSYQALNKTGVYPVYAAGSVKYFGNTKEGYKAMLDDLESAEHFIFLEYFIIDEGDMWDRVEEILTQKAKEGVIVRVVCDGLYFDYDESPEYQDRLEESGAQFRAFSPLTEKGASRSNLRDHRKITVIDGRVAYTGGANISDEYIGIVKPYGELKDNFLRVEGNCVNSFTAMFLQVWDIYGEDRDISEFFTEYDSEDEKNGFILPFSDSPFDEAPVCEKLYLDMINSAEKRLRIMVPYFIPNDRILGALQEAADRGVRIELIVPGTSDNKTVGDAVRTYYQELVDMGVELYEYSPGFVHSKVCIADEELCMVSSANIDGRSLYYDYECGALMYKCTENEAVKKDFDDTVGVCEQITEENVKEKGISGAQKELLRVIAAHF